MSDPEPQKRPVRFAILLVSLLALSGTSGFATTGFGEISRNVAASAVLLAGMLVATLSPGAFYYAHATPVGSAQTESQLIYFSFITLTTVGFGDVTPLTPPASSLIMKDLGSTIA